jgi:predicted enzyme related to lactoylglutathione lyase
MTTEHARVGAIMIDCHDPDALIEFWSQIVGIEAAQTYPSYIFGTKLPGNHIRLAFQRVPEDKTIKNRLHLDLNHPDPGALIAKVVDLGGTRLADHEAAGSHWTVLADPEGNEFCVTSAP